MTNTPEQPGLGLHREPAGTLESIHAAFRSFAMSSTSVTSADLAAALENLQREEARKPAEASALYTATLAKQRASLELFRTVRSELCRIFPGDSLFQHGADDGNR